MYVYMPMSTSHTIINCISISGATENKAYVQAMLYADSN